MKGMPCIFIFIVVICIGCFIHISRSAYAYDYGEFYHTPSDYSCVVAGKPSPYRLAVKILNGESVSVELAYLLESHQLMGPIHPDQLAYALLVIAQRIGDERAIDRLDLARRYLDFYEVDRIQSVVYRKYAQNYLAQCFSIFQPVGSLHISDDIYPIYYD